MFIISDRACAHASFKESRMLNHSSGMWWFGSLVQPVSEEETVEQEMEMIARVQEAAMENAEKLESKLAVLSARSRRHSRSGRGRVGGRHKPDSIMDDDEDLSDDTEASLRQSSTHSRNRGVSTSRFHSGHISKADALALLKVICLITCAFAASALLFAGAAKGCAWAATAMQPRAGHTEGLLAAAHSDGALPAEPVAGSAKKGAPSPEPPATTCLGDEANLRSELGFQAAVEPSVVGVPSSAR